MPKFALKVGILAVFGLFTPMGFSQTFWESIGLSPQSSSAEQIALQYARIMRDGNIEVMRDRFKGPLEKNIPFLDVLLSENSPMMALIDGESQVNSNEIVNALKLVRTDSQGRTIMRVFFNPDEEIKYAASINDRSLLKDEIKELIKSSGDQIIDEGEIKGFATASRSIMTVIVDSFGRSHLVELKMSTRVVNGDDEPHKIYSPKSAFRAFLSSRMLNRSAKDVHFDEPIAMRYTNAHAMSLRYIGELKSGEANQLWLPAYLLESTQAVIYGLPDGNQLHSRFRGQFLEQWGSALAHIYLQRSYATTGSIHPQNARIRFNQFVNSEASRVVETKLIDHAETHFTITEARAELRQIKKSLGEQNAKVLAFGNPDLNNWIDRFDDTPHKVNYYEIRKHFGLSFIRGFGYKLKELVDNNPNAATHAKKFTTFFRVVSIFENVLNNNYENLNKDLALFIIEFRKFDSNDYNEFLINLDHYLMDISRDPILKFNAKTSEAFFETLAYLYHASLFDDNIKKLISLETILNKPYVQSLLFSHLLSNDFSFYKKIKQRIGDNAEQSIGAVLSAMIRISLIKQEYQFMMLSAFSKITNELNFNKLGFSIEPYLISGLLQIAFKNNLNGEKEPAAVIFNLFKMYSPELESVFLANIKIALNQGHKSQNAKVIAEAINYVSSSKELPLKLDNLISKLSDENRSLLKINQNPLTRIADSITAACENLNFAIKKRSN